MYWRCDVARHVQHSGINSAPIYQILQITFHHQPSHAENNLTDDGRLTVWHTDLLSNWAVQIDLQPKNRYNRNIDTPFKNFFFPALKRYMTCHAIYWQKARTKRGDIGGSDRLTAGCVCQRVWINTITGLERSQGCQPYAPGAFTPRNIRGINFCYRLSRPQGYNATGSILSIKNPMRPSGIEPATIRLVSQCLNHCATACPLLGGYCDYIKQAVVEGLWRAIFHLASWMTEYQPLLIKISKEFIQFYSTT
jgi:hypothetical protein